MVGAKEDTVKGQTFSANPLKAFRGSYLTLCNVNTKTLYGGTNNPSESLCDKMLRRPNVRARLYQPNLQTRHAANRKFYPRSHRIYARCCRWCRRPITGTWGFGSWPGLCGECAWYIVNLNSYCHIKRGDNPFDHPRLGPTEPFEEIYYSKHAYPRGHCE